ncbi:hypothetical protein [Helicobacter heilmannii]|uniref:Uncharacterized protein n=2 Tax=Helicobacter heilmannii TaxID=35817 RepID=A0A0K2XKB7_HELHE|nr:hypothetical protein [Helicobacter heilmannii]CCM73460.1 hypothetical protein BN341_8280 [Helicobacter heilmannii ASB1.4]CRF46477.1 hypothetical protein HHE014_14880 [Helicobacter heilmannii]CRF47939.1 hypothetical protein HHE02_12400 [Helicobacter heilmannii]CRF50059.1 hypothetical protein HHE03_17550 [Helicobacter heilmannii]CRI34524.1 hypothetical protein HHE01_13700 [Helicobacter heilmannii]
MPPASVLFWDLDQMYLCTLYKVLGSIGRPAYILLHAKSTYLLKHVPRFRALDKCYTEHTDFTGAFWSIC